MRLVSFDLAQVRDAEDFYQRFAQKLLADQPFGANLDALWDVLTGGVALPLRVTLRHLAGHPAADELRRIVTVMQEAEQETDGAFSVRIS